MNHKSSPFLLGIVIICLLSVGIAFMRFSASQYPIHPSTRPEIIGVSGGSVVSEAARKRFEQLKEREILEIEPETQRSPRFPGTPPAGPLVPSKPTRIGPIPVPPPPSSDGSRPAQGKPAKPSKPAQVAAANSYQAAGQTLRNGTQTPPSKPAFSQPNVQPSAAPSLSNTGGSNAGLSVQTAPHFAPFLRGLTREQADSLNSTLDGLSARVERAIVQASLPKSKKEANIEKYLKRNNTAAQPSATAAAAAGGPFANVINQVAAQKENVVQAMDQTYGSSAAATAGKLMDAYQNELSSTLANKDGKTPEELAKQARAVSQKYNKKLDKLSEKYGLKKFKQENQTKDREFLSDVEKTYGSEISSQMADLRQKALEQKMQLAQETGLTTEEAYKKYLDIERNLWQEEENLLLSNGYSPTKLTKIQGDMQARQRELNEQEQAEGKQVAQVYRMSKEQQQSYLSGVQQMNDKLRQEDVAKYGEEGAQAFASVYERYTREVEKIISDPETSADEKQAAMQKASDQANAERTRLKNSPQMREQQVTTALDHIFQGQSVTSEQRAAYEEYARPILRDMFEQAAQIEQSNLSEQEKRSQLQALNEETKRKLSGGQ